MIRYFRLQMEHIQTFLFSITLLLLFSACKDREAVVTNGSAGTAEAPVVTPEEIEESGSAPGETAANDRPVPTTDQIADSLVFSIARSACFGKCPYYRLQIYESGYATYEGFGNMDRMGLHQTTIPAETRALLIDESEKAGFFEMKNEYDRPVTDIHSTTIIARRGGEVKKVKARVDIPQAFKSLATRVEEILLPMDWKPVGPQH